MEKKQTVESIKAELAKLNESQRKALRGRFWGGLVALEVTSAGTYTRVRFEQESGRVGDVWLGRRGRVCFANVNF